MGLNYSQRKQTHDQIIFEAGMDIGYQRCLDYMQWVLRNPKYVSKDIFGRLRWIKVYEGLKECDQLFGDAFTTGKEADYCQERLDDNIREIFGDDTQPFAERYPMMRKFGYKKSKKGWIE